MDYFMKINGTYFINKDTVYSSEDTELQSLHGLTWEVSDDGATLYYVSKYIQPAILQTVEITDSDIHVMLVDFVTSEANGLAFNIIC